MNIKVFLASSLLLIGTWLTVAFLHSVDLASYPQNHKTQATNSPTLSATTLPTNKEVNSAQKVAKNTSAEPTSSAN